jgi:hypothetical protein
VPEIDTSKPHSARIYDYRLGGTGDFARLALSGLELVPPGEVLVSEWQPDSDGRRPTRAEVSCYGASRKR